ncbi:MAG: DUF3383 family protein [Sutterella wadsworthensis]|jgi:hypothetical protein|nr:DUF3383 family protein [Sutterella wadsworthensis]
MAISASYIVKVTPRVISGGGNDLETNGLLLTNNAEKFPEGAPKARVFVSAADVAATFGDTADETKFAQQYFMGENNQQKIPTALVIGYFDNVEAKVVTNMKDITKVTQNFVMFTTLQKVKDIGTARALAEWASSGGEEYIYVCWDDSQATLNNKTKGTTLLGQLSTGADYSCLATVFGGYADAAFALGIGASINWNLASGLKTWFGKSTRNLSPKITNEADAKELDDIRTNYFGEFATRNEGFKMFYRGALVSKRYGFIDTLIGAIWLRNAIQLACMSGLTSINRAPNNPVGEAYIRAWIGDPIAKAKKCGIIDSSVTLSNAQQTQLLNETTDQDIVNAIFTNGYWLGVTQATPNERADRKPATVQLYYSYAGAIQCLDVAATTLT